MVYNEYCSDSSSSTFNKYCSMQYKQYMQCLTSTSTIFLVLFDVSFFFLRVKAHQNLSSRWRLAPIHTKYTNNIKHSKKHKVQIVQRYRLLIKPMADNLTSESLTTLAKNKRCVRVVVKGYESIMYNNKFFNGYVLC